MLMTDTDGTRPSSSDPEQQRARLDRLEADIEAAKQEIGEHLEDEPPERTFARDEPGSGAEAQPPG
jgi:hypothetical protein